MFEQLVVKLRFKQPSVVDLIQAVRACKHVPLEVNCPSTRNRLLLDIRYPVMWISTETNSLFSPIVFPLGPLPEEEDDVAVQLNTLV